MLLLIQGLLAPRLAWAGCNHLVHSIVQKHGASVNLDALITGWISTEIEKRPGDSSQTFTSPALLRAIVLRPRPVTCLRERGGCCRSRPVGRALGLINFEAGDCRVEAAEEGPTSHVEKSKRCLITGPFPVRLRYRLKTLPREPRFKNSRQDTS